MIQWDLMNNKSRIDYFQTVVNRLPVYRNGYVKVYCPDVHYNEFPSGRNHVTHAQIYHHAVYCYVMSKLGLMDQQTSNALRLFLHRRLGLITGYKFDYKGNVQHSSDSCNPEYLSAITLAVMQSKDDALLEEFEQCIVGIIENDYAFKSDNGEIFKHFKYSTKTIHLLAALSFFNGKSKFLTKEYYKVFFKNLGFLTSFKLESMCDYIAAYVLCQNSSPVMSIFWRTIFKLNWTFSYFRYNGFIAGLVEDEFPGTYDTMKKGYIVRDLFSGNVPWYDKLNRKRKGLAWLANFVSIDTEQCKSLLKGDIK